MYDHPSLPDSESSAPISYQELQHINDLNDDDDDDDNNNHQKLYNNLFYDNTDKKGNDTIDDDIGDIPVDLTNGPNTTAYDFFFADNNI